MSLHLFCPEVLTLELLDNLVGSADKVVLVCLKGKAQEEIDNLIGRYKRAYPAKELTNVGYIEVMDMSSDCFERFSKTIGEENVTWVL